MTGTGGARLSLVENGLVSGVLDVTTPSWPTRSSAACSAGRAPVAHRRPPTPRLVSVGALDM